MPLYEYVCPNCGEKFEAFRLLKERNDAIACPECGQESDRVMSGFAMRTGGGGGGAAAAASCGSGWSGG